MELGVAQHVRADTYERAVNRSGERNGYCDRNCDTRVGRSSCALRVSATVGTSRCCWSRVAAGERALVVVVQTAHVNGVRTRRVDGLVKALGMTGISKRQISSLAPDTGHTGRALSDAQARGQLRLPPARPHIREGQAQRPSRRRYGGRDRGGRQSGWPARGARPGRRAQRGRRVLAGVPAQSCGDRACASSAACSTATTPGGTSRRCAATCLPTRKLSASCSIGRDVTERKALADTPGGAPCLPHCWSRTWPARSMPMQLPSACSSRCTLCATHVPSKPCSPHRQSRRGEDAGRPTALHVRRPRLFWSCAGVLRPAVRLVALPLLCTPGHLAHPWQARRFRR